MIAIAMPFHFKRKEPPVLAVRRVCREHIREALESLRKPYHPAAIHGVRKEIKKLRAIFQLVQGKMSRGDYRKAAKTLRQAAERLAAPRDAQVMLKAFEKLAGDSAARRFPKVGKILQKHYRSTTGRFRDDDAFSAAKQILRKMKKRTGRLEIDAGGWSAIEPGLRQSYRLGWQAAELASRQPSPENFHAWRRHVKIFGYQLRLLCPEWPAATRIMADDLEKLGEVLGDDHDLDLLKRFIAELSGSQAGNLAALGQLIESRQEKLRSAALHAGLRLYSESPAEVCARLGRHWNAWRDGK
jgi:CHAD domain-containing protein